MKKVFEFFAKIPQDKLLHFIFGLLIYFLVATAVGHFTEDGCVIRASGLGTVFFIGALKELWFDKKYGGNPEVSDAGATYLGCFSGMILSLIL